MNKPTVKTLKALKTKLKKTLPARISSVMQSYDEFADQLPPEDAKGFCAHHNACKSAVVHAETLLKLARWTEGEAEDNSAPVSASPLAELLAEAAAAAERTEDEEES